MTTGQTDRIDTILRQLHESERDRRLVAASGATPNHGRHNTLANEIRQQVGAMSTADLRSLALRMIVDSLNGSKWRRCEGCGRPDYLGEAAL